MKPGSPLRSKFVAGNRKAETTGTDKDITCLDDVLGVDCLAARQEFLAKWARVLALVPFAAAIFVAFKFFPGANSWTQVLLVFGAVIWAMAVAGYALYLFFAVRCPACKSRFGPGKNCRSCALPRHHGGSRRIEGKTPN
jgi:amino acid transporter